MKHVLVFSLVLASGFALDPAPAVAKNPAVVATEACQRAVRKKAQRQYNPNRVQFLGRAKTRQASNAETGVRGKGQLDTHRGWVPFSYNCIYNIRSGKPGHISIKARGGGQDSPASSGESLGTAVGTIIGAAIAGAIIDAIDPDARNNTASEDDGWWSPAAGVQCNSYQSACFENGQFSGRWTHKIYE